MNSFSVVDANDVYWDKSLLGSKQYDFYHTSCYHLLEKTGTPYLFVAKSHNDFIALPLILRKIEDTPYWDCTSAYGYCGPVSNLDFQDIPEELFSYFRTQLNQYFRDNNIISAFSRLHPLIIGDGVFLDMGEVKAINQTVAISLKLSPEEQRMQYRKSNKSEINQLRGKKGFEIKIADSEAEIRKFTEIYQETMTRVEARENYFFDFDYFNSFLNNNCFSSKLLLAMKDGALTAGAIFTITNNIMQYHLAGTTEKYIRDTPMKLIIDHARILGNELKLEYLHLGGGVGGSDEDPLFKFKSGFSDKRCVYRVWQYIADEEKYKEVCELKIGNKRVNGNYFPLYRAD